MSEDQKRLFIISPIRSPGTDEHEHFDKVRRHIICPAAEEKGYVPLRADQIQRPGRITSQIVERLMEDELVIADISTGNPNVFYELAIRHAVKKPVILIGDGTEKIPFDIRDQRIIPYSLDPDDIERAKKEITSQIDAIEDHRFRVDSPIANLIHIEVSSISDSESNILKLIMEKLDYQGSELRRMTEIIESDDIISIRTPSKQQTAVGLAIQYKLLDYMQENSRFFTVNQLSRALNISTGDVKNALTQLGVLGLIGETGSHPIEYIAIPNFSQEDKDE